MPFDLQNWKRRFESNSKEAERNSLMDSGWSPRTAESCMRTAASLYRELVVAIAITDIADRMELVAIQEAARFSTSESA